MKRKFSDLIKKKYSTRLLVNAKEMPGSGYKQLNGFSFPRELPQGFSFDGEALAERASVGILLLKPAFLRYYAGSACADQISAFCVKNQIDPLLVIDQTVSLENLADIVVQAMESFAVDDLWVPQRIYEIGSPAAGFPDVDDEGAEAIFSQYSAMARIIKESDPESMVILPGITPVDNDIVRAEEWNMKIISQCGDVMDMLGLGWDYPGKNNWQLDENEDGLEAACALADVLLLMLRRAHSQLAMNAQTGKQIRLALTSWSYNKKRPLTKQDAFYYAAVLQRIQAQPALIQLNCCGPLFGDEGLIQICEDELWTDSAYEFFMTQHSSQPLTLNISVDPSKPLPCCNWAGIPGQVDPGQIVLLEASASRSADGRLLHITVCNRHAYRRAEVRCELVYFQEMRPLEAYVLRGKDRLACNLQADTQAVYCGEIKMRKYRKMDHVNLDIPPAAVVSMLLTTD